MDPLKANTALEAAKSQKEGKAEAKLEKDRFGGSRKCCKSCSEKFINCPTRCDSYQFFIFL